jgi:predicted phage terminase large subunit-like protein
MTKKEKLILALQKAKTDLINFRHILLSNSTGEVSCAAFHYHWSDLLLHNKEHTAIQAFRESGKTQYILRSFLLYSLMFPSELRDYIIIIKKNQTLARNVLREIENEARSNPIMEANCRKTLEESGDVFCVDRIAEDGRVVNVRIEAYGKGASIRGLANRDRRPRIAIIDDPQDVEDARSETVQFTDWEWFLSDVMFLGQNTRIFLVGNNLGEKSIIERIFANAVQLGFKTVKIKIMEDDRSMWPEKYTLAEIDQEKNAFREMGKLDVWLRERMCEAISPETRIFDPADYRYFTPALVNKISERCNIFATLDPASSSDLKSCYRAIVVNAVNQDNIWNILDVPYGRWDSAQLIEMIFETVVKWRIKDFGIEKGIFKQILEPFIYKEMAKRNVFFNIVPIEHAQQGTKLERIKMLQPRFKAHSIWFPEEAPWLAEIEAELAGITKDAIKSLYSDLCLAKGTEIATLSGNKKIEDVKCDDLVITPFGVSKVLSAKFTGVKKVIRKFGLIATAEHKIFCYKKGFASIDTLCYTNQVSRYNIKEAIRWQYKRLLYLMAGNSLLIQRENIITVSGMLIADTIGMDFIKRFGNFIIRGQFRKVGIFITLMAIYTITTFLIWNVYHLSNIIKSLKTLICRQSENILQRLGRLLLNGINLKKVAFGISNMLLRALKIGNQKLESAIYAIKNINISILPLNIVLQNAYNNQLQLVADYTKKGNVLFAEKNLNAENISLLKPVQEFAQQNTAGNIPQSANEDNLPVYNLTIEAIGVYYANGLLVSNCDALAMQEQIVKKPYFGSNLTGRNLPRQAETEPILIH